MGNCGTIWVRTRLTPNTKLERDGGILGGAWYPDTRQSKLLANNLWVLKFW